MRLRLRLYAPRKLASTEGETEIEQYSQGAERHAMPREAGHAVEVQAAAGPQFRFGSDSGADAEVTDGDESGGGTGHHGGGPGGRVTAMAQGSARLNWATFREHEEGFIDVTRAT
ncbi:hypothetical protein NGM37_17645, partial [Streptomyces sp. TRM76130]|nr:hypothetical protein [Streptomyces sp. TRM76130]